MPTQISQSLLLCWSLHLGCVFVSNTAMTRDMGLVKQSSPIVCHPEMPMDRVLSVVDELHWRRRVKGMSKATRPGSLLLPLHTGATWLLPEEGSGKLIPGISITQGHHREHTSFGFLLHSLHNGTTSLLLLPESTQNADKVLGSKALSVFPAPGTQQAVQQGKHPGGHSRS